MLDDFCALCTHESDSRVADPVGKVDSALDAERARSTGGGESRVAARGNRQAHVRAVRAEGVLCEVGDAARLEGLCRLEILFWDGNEPLKDNES